MSTVAEYQAAFRKHAAAHKAANEMVQQVHNVSKAIGSSLRSFMGYNFKEQIDNKRERYDPKAQVDLKMWPNADQLGETLKAWNAADSELRAAWDALSAEDRQGLTSPPHDMQLNASRY